MVDYYKEEIAINLTREEAIQVLDLLAEMVRLGYSPYRVIDIHHKIFGQVFDEVSLTFRGVKNEK